ncbi:MAG: serine/threonine-protein phosphatase [Cytophagales bacterium]|nr:MAG: serine/threonine-protein phosphatase [Cytophagales bacterium]
MTQPQLNIAGQTDVGRQRQDNQDTFISQTLWTDGQVLLAVIDGVGGYAGGAEAAALAREAIIRYMTAPTGDTLTMLREAVVYANNQIVAGRQSDPALARMSCVLTVAVADAQAGRVQFVHVGDTRLYRFRKGQAEKLTHDHSLVGVREDAHQLTEREAMLHPRRNEILRDVGSRNHRIDDPEFLESGEADLLPGDVLLLCSDGLTDMITRAQITGVLTQSLPLNAQVTELIHQANEHGGHDNITVVLAQFPAASGDAVAQPIAQTSTVASTVETKRTPAAVNMPQSDHKLTKSAGVAPFLLWLLGGLGLAVLLWFQFGATKAPPPPVPPSAPADTLIRRTPTNTTDSTRTP